MGVVYAKEVVRGRSYSGKRNDGESAKREFLVRLDVPSTPVTTIAAAPGVNYGDPHPNRESLVCESFDVKPADDSGLVYTVSFEYKKPDKDDQDPGEGEKPGEFDGKIPTWGGSSGVVVRPVYKDAAGQIMANSAGDPLEGLEAEQAEERLTLVQYFASHTQWQGVARSYTNAINAAAWNGGAPRSWKCQGCSKKLNIESKNGVTTVYWELAWEFAYKADLWTLKPWDIGFAQLVDENGDPAAYGAKRAQIKGQDGKAVKHPVGLNNQGVALPAGQRPLVCNNPLGFFIYPELDFVSVFGELYTPSFGGA